MSVSGGGVDVTISLGLEEVAQIHDEEAIGHVRHPWFTSVPYILPSVIEAVKDLPFKASWTEDGIYLTVPPGDRSALEAALLIVEGLDYEMGYVEGNIRLTPVKKREPLVFDVEHRQCGKTFIFELPVTTTLGELKDKICRATRASLGHIQAADMCLIVEKNLGQPYRGPYPLGSDDHQSLEECAYPVRSLSVQKKDMVFDIEDGSEA